MKGPLHAGPSDIVWQVSRRGRSGQQAQPAKAVPAHTVCPNRNGRDRCDQEQRVNGLDSEHMDQNQPGASAQQPRSDAIVKSRFHFLFSDGCEFRPTRNAAGDDPHSSHLRTRKLPGRSRACPLSCLQRIISFTSGGTKGDVPPATVLGEPPELLFRHSLQVTPGKDWWQRKLTPCDAMTCAVTQGTT